VRRNRCKPLGTDPPDGQSVKPAQVADEDTHLEILRAVEPTLALPGIRMSLPPSSPKETLDLVAKREALQRVLESQALALPANDETWASPDLQA
jgi:hypothetical protein